MKKWTALFLALLFALALCPSAALAAEAPPFDDIQDQPNQEAILWCYDEGLLQGVGNGRFHPQGQVTRAMAAAVLFRGGEPVDMPATYFGDVPVNAWYSAAVRWAAYHGYINGTGQGMFSPGLAVTRQDLALMLRRQACCDEVDRDVSFAADGADVAPYAQDAVAWAYRQGTLRLDGEKKLHPREPVTRGQLASILKAFYGERETVFSLDPDQITELTLRSGEGRDDLNATAEQIQWIADWLNQFPVWEAVEAEVSGLAWDYSMEFTAGSQAQELRVVLCSDQSLYVEDSDQEVFYYGKPLTGLTSFLEQCFKDVPFVDPAAVQLLDVNPEDVDKITVREFATGAQADITAPEDIAQAAQALSQVKAYPCKDPVLPECWDYIVEIASQKEELNGASLRLCHGTYLVLSQGETATPYMPSGDTDAPLWELVERTIRPIPDKVDKLFDIDPNQVEKLEIRNGGDGTLVSIAGQGEIAKLVRALNQFGYVEENAGHDAVGYQYYIDFTSSSEALKDLRVTVVSPDCLLVSRPGQDGTLMEYLSPGYAAGLLELLDGYFQPLPDKGTPPEA